MEKIKWGGAAVGRERDRHESVVSMRTGAAIADAKVVVARDRRVALYTFTRNSECTLYDERKE